MCLDISGTTQGHVCIFGLVHVHLCQISWIIHGSPRYNPNLLVSLTTGLLDTKESVLSTVLTLILETFGQCWGIFDVFLRLNWWNSILVHTVFLGVKIRYNFAA